MSESHLLTRLDDELAHLPSVAASSYLLEGRRARRRRRATAAVVAAAAAAAVAVGVLQVLAPGGSGESLIAEDPTGTAEEQVDLSGDPDFVAPEPNNPLEAQDGLDGIDWFTTTDIPSWAEEYGNHGPINVRPDGRLWVAPDATVRRIVVDPFTYGKAGDTRSYAVEAVCTCAPEDMPDDVVWVWMSAGGSGYMDVPGWTTDDFELWVDAATALQQGRPSLGERLARFAEPGSGRMVAGATGVTLVDQVADPDLGSGREKHTRAGAAEVEYAGQTFYVVGVDPEEGAPWYRSWPGDAHPDFASFLTMLRGNW
ncbi:hypothetical protein NOCA170220 [metagenome]|uniref:Uncharacterized protein n=1 Tax=metagenome TaxID=256318 RepID=A0A2P2CJW8_9ZZZZ